ncbi:MAG: DUF2868 domain-containing protein [Desulfobacterales bacterium]
MKKKNWRIRDLIDLEYFLNDNEGIQDKPDSEDQHLIDRKIYLNHIEPVFPKSDDRNSDHRKWILRLWLEKRREIEKEKNGREDLLPGDAFHITYQLMVPIFIIAGTLFGAGAAFSFLVYKGTAPINVSAYMGLFVLTQVLLIVLIFVFFYLKRRTGNFSRPSLLHTLMGRFLTGMVIRLKEGVYSKLSGEKRYRIEAAIGLARGKRKVYGTVFYWPFFILAQIFAVSFNIGVLSATILKVIGSDLAFGWQSTIRISSQAVYGAVALISSPWSWFIPETIAHPSLTQIEGSRMILKDGIYHLSTSGLISWWPFLCFSVLCYGFFPRLFLLAGGIAAGKKAILKIGFHNTECDRLMLRMKTPVINTGGFPEEELDYETFQFDAISPFPPVGAEAGFITESSIIALVPGDIINSCSGNEFKKAVAECTGLKLIQIISFGLNPEEDRKALEFISRIRWDEERPNLMVVQEAWQPPIKEIILFLKQLRKTIGEKTLIRIGLIGKPGPDTIFTAVKAENITVWKNAVVRLGDPSVLIENLGCKNE